MTHDGRPVRLGVDIGGTFTDIAMEVGSRLHSIKVLTTYAAPEHAILDGIERVSTQRASRPARSISSSTARPWPPMR